jgi:hypothetical protein
MADSGLGWGVKNELVGYCGGNARVITMAVEDVLVEYGLCTMRMWDTCDWIGSLTHRLLSWHLLSRMKREQQNWHVDSLLDRWDMTFVLSEPNDNSFLCPQDAVYHNQNVAIYIYFHRCIGISLLLVAALNRSISMLLLLS